MFGFTPYAQAPYASLGNAVYAVNISGSQNWGEN